VKRTTPLGARVTTCVTKQTFSYWLSRPFVDSSLKAAISQANVLLVPHEEYRGSTVPVFPEHSDELLHFLKSRTGESLRPDICISDDDYAEVALHSLDLTTAGLIVQWLVAPYVVNLLAEYTKEWLFRHRGCPTDTKVVCSMTIEGPEVAIKVDYSGPASDFGEFTAAVRGAVATVSGKQQDPSDGTGPPLPGDRAPAG
jgi:hypothetical protein